MEKIDEVLNLLKSYDGADYKEKIKSSLYLLWGNLKLSSFQQQEALALAEGLVSCVEVLESTHIEFIKKILTSLKHNQINDSDIVSYRSLAIDLGYRPLWFLE